MTQTKAFQIQVPEGYSAVKSLGSGTFGQVVLAKRIEDASLVVIKQIQKVPERAHLIKNEVEAGRKLKHSNIVGFVDYIETKQTSNLVLEYIEGSDLFEFLGNRNFSPLPEEMGKNMFRTLAKAVHHCHRKGIAHLDLKIENVLITPEGSLKLFDFGLCSMFDPKKPSKLWVGSPDYASPQILLRTPYSEPKADVWSLGIILFIMLLGQIPFDRDERYRYLQKGSHPELAWSTNESKLISTDAKDLLSKMLIVDADKRISMSEVMKHKWVKQNSWRLPSLGL
eukprot:TRINITY_DN15180_c0_g1_i1.p1 TRINITY_DN15180_c0_g1~~TRINITY_DN15180_c0_g1_i1.p1  ORF type:complete len:282 (-),score=60.25 TRINITY_DN15180_c0_g1_i1:518-1363(-)